MFKPIDINIDEILEILNALGDRTRQEIILLFAAREEACVNEISDQFKLSRPTISHHLNLMKRAKVLNARKDGKEIYYSFNRDYVVVVLENMTNYLKKCC